MIVDAQVTINGSKEAVWAAISNIENAAEAISGIEEIEVLLRIGEIIGLFGQAPA